RRRARRVALSSSLRSPHLERGSESIVRLPAVALAPASRDDRVRVARVARCGDPREPVLQERIDEVRGTAGRIELAWRVEHLARELAIGIGRALTCRHGPAALLPTAGRARHLDDGLTT